MIAVATWNDGLFLVGAASRHELAGRSLRGLTSDRHGGLVAIVDGNTLQRRTADGEWHTLATSDLPLACCVALPDALFVGTDDARVLRWTDGAGLEPLAAFARVAGRERWYAGTAVVDGKVVGPPLGVRSMCASCDDRTLLVNVHVGGICRSTDGGQSWEPTIDVDADVHEVRAHPERADTLVAAAAVGLCISTDGGRSWSNRPRRAARSALFGRRLQRGRRAGIGVHRPVRLRGRGLPYVARGRRHAADARRIAALARGRSGHRVYRRARGGNRNRRPRWAAVRVGGRRRQLVRPRRAACRWPTSLRPPFLYCACFAQLNICQASSVQEGIAWRRTCA